MRRKLLSPVWCRAWIGLVLLACLGAARVARADGPMLTIRLTGGQQAIYAVSEVQRIGFDGDTLVVVKDTREAGRHTASWDGRDDAGEKVGSGTYFYQLIAPGVEESRRMILLP